MPSADYNPVVVRLEGEIDIGTSEDVLHELTKAAALSDDVVIDLQDVTFIDSTGIGLLAQALSKGATLVLDGAPEHVRRVIEMSGINEPLV